MIEPNLDLPARLVEKVLDYQTDVRDDLRETKTRLGRLETHVAELHL
jgi:hypothetical protein